MQKYSGHDFLYLYFKFILDICLLDLNVVQVLERYYILLCNDMLVEFGFVFIGVWNKGNKFCYILSFQNTLSFLSIDVTFGKLEALNSVTSVSQETIGEIFYRAKIGKVSKISYSILRYNATSIFVH
jgi:hypothetical protein